MFIENLFLLITMLYIIFSLIGLYGRCSLYESAYEDINILSSLKDRLSGFTNFIKTKKDLTSSLENDPKRYFNNGLTSTPPILLEGFESHHENDDFSSPSYDILNDRYNKNKKQYSDEDLYSSIINKSTLLGDNEEYNHDSNMLDYAMNDSNDADKLIFEKTRALQNHYKLSDAIEKNKSKSSIMESFKNDYHNIETEWWGGYESD